MGKQKVFEEITRVTSPHVTVWCRSTVAAPQRLGKCPTLRASYSTFVLSTTHIVQYMPDYLELKLKEYSLPLYRVSTCQCFQDYFDAPSTRVCHSLPLQQPSLEICAPTNAGLCVPRCLSSLSGLPNCISQVRRAGRERVCEGSERIDEGAGWRARPSVCVQLLACRRDRTGPVFCSCYASA